MSKDRSYSTAIHILTALAYRDPELTNSEDLARSLKTNPGLVRRIMCKLSEKGLVTTIKGKGGGSRLAKSAQKISLGEIYLAVKDSPLFGSFDKEPLEECKVSCNIGEVLTRVYDDLEGDLVKNMNKVKLTEIIKEIG